MTPATFQPPPTPRRRLGVGSMDRLHQPCWWRMAVLGLFYVGSMALAAANPVRIDPLGDASIYVFGMVAAICIVVEVAMIWLLSRVFHDFDGDRLALGLLAVLNMATLALVLTPLLRLTGSTILAEGGVVLAETIGIQKIMGISGIQLGLRRAALYALIANGTLFIIGVLSQ